MKTRDTRSAIQLVRMASVLRYVRYLEGAGAPVGRLLARSGIPEVLLDHPAAVVPQHSAFAFGELACRVLGTEHLGVHVGLASGLEGLGPYGDMLQSSLTLWDYLLKGVSLYNMLSTGQRLWLSEHGKDLRLHIETVGEPAISAYQSQLETLIVTVAQIRNAVGVAWSPAEVSLAYRARENFPEIDLFAATQVLSGTGETYLTIPRALLGSRFAGGDHASGRDGGSPFADPLPEDFGRLVQHQIACLISDRSVQIDTVAESLQMSRRSLQRGLESQGLTYSQILSETRKRQAAQWLEQTDKPVAEIAFDLGYSDPSNFTRAFRRRTGISPQAFRDASRAA